MFYVHHNDDQTSVFNAKCQSVVLMNHIRKTLGVAGVIDLLPQAAEYKTAAPLGACEKPEGTYGNTFLQPRAHYVLLQATEDEEGVKEYAVLWKSKTDEADRIASALDMRTQDERKKTGAKKGKK